MNKKSFISIILCILMCTIFLCLYANAATIKSGKVGDNITWIYNSNGNLTIKGNGDLSYYSDWKFAPSSVKNIVIEDGITSLRDCVFMDFTSLETVTIPPSVIKIDMGEPYAYTAGGAVFVFNPEISNLTIYGYSGTYAEEFAAFIRDYKFISLGTYEYPAERKIIDSGTCDNNITWTIDDMRTLTIKGPGIIDYQEDPPEHDGPWWLRPPWSGYLYCIKTVIIEEGVTEIKDSSFFEAPMLRSAIFPRSLTGIPAVEFRDSPNVTIYGYKGTCVEDHAIKNNIAFIPLDGTIYDTWANEHPEIKITIGQPTISKNGVATPLDVPAQLINSRTMVLLRAIFEALGAYVHWDDTTSTITSIKDNTVVILVIGQNSINVNGVDKPLDVPAMLVDSRTLVPARAVAESFGCDVLWDDTTQTVTIR